MKLASYSWNFKIVQDSVIILTDQPIFQSGEEGKRVWEGGIIFSRFAVNNSTLFRNKSILELGCGGGISGIALLKYTNAKYVLFTDYKEALFPLVKKNIEENAVKSPHIHSNIPFKATTECESFTLSEYFKEEKWKELVGGGIITSKAPICVNCVLCNKDKWGIQRIDWTEPVPKEMIGRFDIIIGSDIIYIGSHHEKLYAYLRDISKGNLLYNI